MLPFYSDSDITRKQVRYQDAQRGIDAYNSLQRDGILSTMHKDDRIQHKKAFVENLNIRNEIFKEFRMARKETVRYNEKTFGKKSIELHFWDETVSC